MRRWLPRRRSRTEARRVAEGGWIRTIDQGPANHFLNGEGVGGWLYLTDHRVLFRSHKVNLQPHELSVALGEIAEVHAARTARIIPNGLHLILRSGRDERFVVEAHKKWCHEIARAQTRAASKNASH